MFKFPVIELIDKYCIAQLKLEKGLNCKPEYEFYFGQIQSLNLELIKEDLKELKEVHTEIWDYEDDFKKFTVEKKYPVEEVARRAIMIRNLNAKRYEIKNKIADKLNDPVKEIKRWVYD